MISLFALIRIVALLIIMLKIFHFWDDFDIIISEATNWLSWMKESINYIFHSQIFEYGS